MFLYLALSFQVLAPSCTWKCEASALSQVEILEHCGDFGREGSVVDLLEEPVVYRAIAPAEDRRC